LTASQEENQGAATPSACAFIWGIPLALQNRAARHGSKTMRQENVLAARRFAEASIPGRPTASLPVRIMFCFFSIGSEYVESNPPGISPVSSFGDQCSQPSRIE